MRSRPPLFSTVDLDRILRITRNPLESRQNNLKLSATHKGFLNYEVRLRTIKIFILWPLSISVRRVLL
jgi:hypothetical protein